MRNINKNKPISLSEIDSDNNTSKKTFLNRYFKMDYLKSTIKKEIIGGFSSFISSIYIVSVEPSILSQAPGIDDTQSLTYGGIFLSTIFIIFFSTFLMGAVSNLPLILAPSMSVNAMFTFTVASNNGLGYQGALLCVCISSILFLIVSLTKLRTIIIQSIPKSLQIAITCAIGCFIAYVGISSMGWVEKNGNLYEASLSNLPDTYIGIILGMFVFVLILILHFLKVNGSIAISISIGLILAIILANTLNDVNGINSIGGVANSGPLANAKWNGWNYDLSGFNTNIKNFFREIDNKEIWTNPSLYICSLVFFLLVFTDATSTITAANEYVTELSKVKESLVPKSAFVIDSSSSIIASIFCVSHIATLSESTVGIASGARTGLSSIFASVLFLLSLPLYPLVAMIPSCVIAAPMLFVGASMFGQIKRIDFAKPEIMFSTFVLLIFTIVTYNITNGIALSFFVYTIIMLALKKVKEINLTLWILDAIFIVYFVLQAFIK